MDDQNQQSGGDVNTDGSIPVQVNVGPPANPQPAASTLQQFTAIDSDNNQFNQTITQTAQPAQTTYETNQPQMQPHQAPVQPPNIPNNMTQNVFIPEGLDNLTVNNTVLQQQRKSWFDKLLEKKWFVIVAGLAIFAVVGLSGYLYSTYFKDKKPEVLQAASQSSSSINDVTDLMIYGHLSDSIVYTGGGEELLEPSASLNEDITSALQRAGKNYQEFHKLAKPYTTIHNDEFGKNIAAFDASQSQCIGKLTVAQADLALLGDVTRPHSKAMTKIYNDRKNADYEVNSNIVAGKQYISELTKFKDDLAKLSLKDTDLVELRKFYVDRFTADIVSIQSAIDGADSSGTSYSSANSKLGDVLFDSGSYFDQSDVEKTKSFYNNINKICYDSPAQKAVFDEYKKFDFDSADQSIFDKLKIFN